MYTNVYLKHITVTYYFNKSNKKERKQDFYDVRG